MAVDHALREARAKAKDAAMKAYIARRMGDQEYLEGDHKTAKRYYEIARQMDVECDKYCKVAAKQRHK